MKRQDLLDLIAEQLLKGNTRIALTFSAWPFAAQFPRGKLLSKDDDGSQMRAYRPSQLLAWIERRDAAAHSAAVAKKEREARCKAPT